MIVRNKLLLTIFFLALFLRLIKLGSFPHGFHADEVRVGWNAVSIAKTGQDDRGNRFALHYNTFGDFRPTGIFYFTVPSVVFFGANEFSVRLPSALIGALTVFPLFSLTYFLTGKKGVAVFAAFLLAVSPWHVSVSRATSEVAISLFFTLAGLVLFLVSVKTASSKSLLGSFLLLLVSYLLYHSARILIPLFALALLLSFVKTIKKDFLRKSALFVLALFVVSALFSFNREARGRFNQVSIFKDLDVAYELSRMPFEEGPNKVFIARLFHNKPTVYVRRFIKEYANYLSTDFLIAEDGKPGRYQTPGLGVLTFVEAGLFLVGLITIAKRERLTLPLLLLLLSIVPAALTTEDAPNLHRSFYMVAFAAMIEAIGLSYLKEKGVFKKTLFYPAVFLLVLNFVFYFHMYFTHAKFANASSRNSGAKELALKIIALKDQYDEIILTNIPDDPYPWIAFFGHIDPKVFNLAAGAREKGTWRYENMTFTGLRCPSRDAFEKPEVKALLVVDAEACATESNLKERSDVEILGTILRPDESEVYTLWSRVEER